MINKQLAPEGAGKIPISFFSSIFRKERPSGLYLKQVQRAGFIMHESGRKTHELLFLSVATLAMIIDWRPLGRGGGVLC